MRLLRKDNTLDRDIHELTSARFDAATCTIECVTTTGETITVRPDNVPDGIGMMTKLVQTGFLEVEAPL